MRKLVVMAAILMLVAANTAWAGTAVLSNLTQDYGVVTYKFAIDSDSNEALGHHHKSSGALKTPWVNVPFGTEFAVFVETRDSDSTASAYYPWGPDTIGLALETAPASGIIIDSTGQYKRNKADIIWDLRSLNWTDFTSQHYFPAVFADTLNDSAASSDTEYASTVCNKAITPQVNLGKLRFSLCVDAADSLLDGIVRLNCYIIFKAPEEKRYKQFGFNSDGDPHYTSVDNPELRRVVHQPWALAQNPRKPFIGGTR